MRNNVTKLSRVLLACLLALSMIFGIGAMYSPTAIAADDSTYQDPSQIIPTQVQAAEKPYVTIETNLVVDATGKPTGYVELALKVTTPTLYYADKEMTILRYAGDGLEDKTGYASLGAFNPENHSTYVTTRQTTFRDIAVTLEYDNKLLMPVSWTHSAEDGDSTGYPDFFFDYYYHGYEQIEADTTINGVTVKPGIYKSEDIEALRKAADPTTITITPLSETDIMADFHSYVDFSVSVPVLQDSTDITSAMAFTQTNVENGVNTGTSLLALAVNSSVDVAFPEETTLAVVRFYYRGALGTDGITEISAAIKPTDAGGREVDTNQFISGHDRASTTTGGTLKSLFNFAPDDSLATAPARQILYYSAGNYVGYPGDNVDDMGEGANIFYSTKYIYQGSEVTSPSYGSNFVTVSPNKPAGSTGNYTESTVLKDASGGSLDLPLTGTPQTGATDPYYGTGRKVVPAINESLTQGANGYYSYTTNLLFTSDTQSFKQHSNVRFTMAAEESYNAGGGTDIENVTTIVFLDWDDSILGALSVVKGDARAAVEAYVENFIHPTLRASAYKNSDTDDDKETLKNLATSLERQYTYAGEYPNSKVEKTDGDGNKTMVFEDNGSNTFPDDHAEAGNLYPLTNKLDYAFLRRPVTLRTEIDADAGEKYYQDADGNYVDAIEWTTGIVDYTGTATPDDSNDNFFYIHGWALVEERNREDSSITDDVVSDGVWTTFSGSGELGNVKLPGYDIDGDYNGIDKYNSNVIAPAGAKDDDAVSATQNGKALAKGGATSLKSGGKAISFATYDASGYFEFADFSKVESDEIYVKACYEPAEEVSWIDYYTISSEEPYYVRYGTAASTVIGSVYGIKFDYERITGSGVGVLRARNPYVKIQYTRDEKGTVGDSFYVGVPQNSTDTITAELTPTSSLGSIQYNLVETYGYGNYVQSGNRSVMGSEVFVLDNFTYRTDDSVQESYENGYDYENRLGSIGYVYSATLRQIMEEGTAAALSDMAVGNGSTTYRLQFVNRYVSNATLLDLNLRLDDNGALGDGTGITENADIFIARAKNAIYDAIYQVLENKAYDYIGDDGIVNLDWHQLQYHILNWNYSSSGGGIAQGDGILAPEKCGSYAWCRQDECSEKVSVTVSDLVSALKAIEIYNTDTGEKKTAAEKALSESLISILTDNYILDEDAIAKNNDLIFTREDAKKNAAYIDWSAVADDLYKLIEQCGQDGVEYTTLTAWQVQDWLSTYEGAGTGTYRNPDEDLTEGSKNIKYVYWWQKYEYKQYVIEFDDATELDAAELLIDAAVSELVYGNEIAWEQLSIDDLVDMRFSSDGRGDFFGECTYVGGVVTVNGVNVTCDGVQSEYDSYRTLTHDTSDRSLILGTYSDTQPVLDWVRALVTLVGSNGTGEDGATVWKQDVEQLVLDKLKHNEVEEDDYSWYQIQYCLLNSTSTAGVATTDNPEYYTDTYWWKDSPADTDSDGIIDEDEIRLANMRVDAGSSDGYAFTGATMEALRGYLNGYASATSTLMRTTMANQFRAWFTQEVAADLILRRNTSGDFISEVNCYGIETTLLTLADEFKSYGLEFSNLTWSQVQYRIFPNMTYMSTYRAQTRFTYTNSCTWGVKSNEADSNRWREPRKELIPDLKTLIIAINEYSATSSTDQKLDLVTAWSDLEDGIYLKVGTSLGSQQVIPALLELKTAYNKAVWKAETGEGNPWVDLANDENLENAWYLVQYYLDKAAFVTTENQFSVADYIGGTFSNNVLADTAATGKNLYWWKDGWNGVGRYSGAQNGLVEAVYSKISARIDWITGVDSNGNSNMSASNFAGYTRTIKGENGATISWTDEAFVKALQEMTKRTVAWTTNDNRVWWNELQFLVLHYSQGCDYARATATAADEGDAFYWWYDSGKDGTATVAEPITMDKLTGIVLKRLASGYSGNDKFITAANIESFYILVPPTDGKNSAGETVESRGDLDSYIELYGEDKVIEAFEALVRTAYEKAANEGNTWDHVFTPAGAAYDVYTYNETAYSAVTALTVEQVQHWFATYNWTTGTGGSYDADAAAAAGYWWLTSATPKEDNATVRAKFEAFFVDLIAYSLEYMEDPTNTAYRDFIVSRLSTALLTDANIARFAFNTTTAAPTAILTNARNFYNNAATLIPTGASWMQCQILVGRGLANWNPTTAVTMGTRYGYRVIPSSEPDLTGLFTEVKKTAIEEAQRILEQAYAAGASLAEEAAPLTVGSSSGAEEGANGSSSSTDSTYGISGDTDSTYVTGEDASSVKTTPTETPAATYTTVPLEQVNILYAVVPTASENKHAA